MTLIERCNKRLEEVGRSPFGEPLYKWVFVPTLRHWRYQEGKDDWLQHLCGYTPQGQGVHIWIPRPIFEEVLAFPHVGERWALCIWQFQDSASWYRQFGSRVVWPPHGYYFPTDKILKPGRVPDLAVTDYFISCIKYNRGKTFAELEKEIEDELLREEQADFNRMHAMILDAMTAFGNKPGSRSGGVSVFSGKPDDPIRVGGKEANGSDSYLSLPQAA